MTEAKKPKPVDYALAYAAAGYRVLPVWVFKPEGETKYGKYPAKKKDGLAIFCPAHSKKTKAEVLRKCRACRGGVAAATTDPDRIRELWAGKLRRCHVGVIPPEGVIVLDDDGGVFPEWLDGPHVRTPSGNPHLYFTLTDKQDGLKSENGIVYRESPEGLVDIRVSGDGRFYVIAPSGTDLYRKVNGATLDPTRLRPLPDEVYERLLTAPRKATEGGGGPGGGKYLPGVAEAVVGLPYDFRDDEAERWLEELGWTDEGDRWVRPGGTDGAAKVSESEGIWFANIHTFNDSLLSGGHFYTPSMLRCVAEFGGDWRACWAAMTADGSNNIFKKDDDENG